MREAKKIIKEHNIDYVLMDINLKGDIDGAEGVAKLLKQNNDLKIIILSMFCDSSIVEKTIGSGAMAYVCKSDGLDEAVLALEQAKENKKYPSSYVISKLYQSAKVYNQTNSVLSEQMQLSQRQNEIIHCVVSGMDSDKIAEKMRISKRTVETHLQKIYNITRVSSKKELILKFKV